MGVIATKMRAGAAADRPGGGVRPRLSTDFLNRYSEALMLIEMAAMDESVLADLQAWDCVGYREHFAASTLRCAASAIAAYDGLGAERTEAFDALCRSMTELIRSATLRLAETPQPGLGSYVEIAGETLRRQIARATRFINANGAVDIAQFEDTALQEQVDVLLAG